MTNSTIGVECVGIIKHKAEKVVRLFLNWQMVKPVSFSSGGLTWQWWVGVNAKGKRLEIEGQLRGYCNRPGRCQ